MSARCWTTCVNVNACARNVRTQTLTIYANAKVNLGLFIRGRRPDGYHELQTVFVPVLDLYDVLTLTQTPTVAEPTLAVTGITLAGNVNDNLCMRAWHLLKQRVPELPAVTMQLEKRIPAGAGLGGGSSDAAHVLLGLNALFGLGIAEAELRQLGQRLGADVPFFIENTTQLASGTGEILTPITIPELQDKRIELVTPGIHSDTAEAYRGLNYDSITRTGDLAELLKAPIAEWRYTIHNDFEPTVFARYPVLAELKQELYDRGALYAAMSGSGSALFGIFPGLDESDADILKHR